MDDRDSYSPGWKFNEWELKGVPLRIEIGPKDIEQTQVVLVRRDNNKKEFVKIAQLEDKVKEILEEMQNDLFNKAKKFLTEASLFAKGEEELERQIMKAKNKLFDCSNFDNIHQFAQAGADIFVAGS